MREKQLIDALKEAEAAIDGLLHNIGQMKGMFPDEDGTIAEAIEDGEAAQEKIAAALLGVKGRRS